VEEDHFATHGVTPAKTVALVRYEKKNVELDETVVKGILDTLRNTATMEAYKEKFGHFTKLETAAKVMDGIRKQRERLQAQQEQLRRGIQRHNRQLGQGQDDEGVTLIGP